MAIGVTLTKGPFDPVPSRRLIVPDIHSLMSQLHLCAKSPCANFVAGGKAYTTRSQPWDRPSLARLNLDRTISMVSF